MCWDQNISSIVPSDLNQKYLYPIFLMQQILQLELKK